MIGWLEDPPSAGTLSGFQWLEPGTVGQFRVAQSSATPPPALPPPGSTLTAEACNQNYVPWAFSCMQNPTATSDCFRRVTPEALGKLASQCGVDVSKFPVLDCAAHVEWALADLRSPDSRLKKRSREVDQYLAALRATCGADVWKTVFGDLPREQEIRDTVGGTEEKKDNTIWYVAGAVVVGTGLWLIFR